MQETNKTFITEFILLGFQSVKNIWMLFFCLFLLIYCLTICGNFLIIMLVLSCKNLQSPMYIFLTQLSMNDILLITDIVPNMLHMFLKEHGTITFMGCVTQLYFFSASETLECLLLTVMSYDRYVAICNPFHYNSIMNTAFSLKLGVTSWAFSFTVILIDILTISNLKFCDSNIIDHYFCDLAPLLEISCSDTYIVRLEASVLSGPVIVFPCLIIVVSYIHIITTVVRIPSNIGRQKAFSTCISHLTVVSIFYGSLFGVYALPTEGQSLYLNKTLSLLYTVGTPLINPVIYTLRNKDIKIALGKFDCVLSTSVHKINLFYYKHFISMGKIKVPSKDMILDLQNAEMGYKTISKKFGEKGTTVVVIVPK
ncbi:olfactory receptor 1500-like [Hyperolius riggenbachi]|uniref:olfactory receptor 1500-like n=1 Tax=Hyperolius riggenbachi TaxID=752182 RepID=UPI0035A2E829